MSLGRKRQTCGASSSTTNRRWGPRPPPTSRKQAIRFHCRNVGCQATGSRVQVKASIVIVGRLIKLPIPWEAEEQASDQRNIEQGLGARA